MDLVLSTIPDSVSKTQVVESISDHSVVITDLILKVKPTRKVKRKIYIYKKEDSELLKDEISSAWDKFQTSQPHDRSVEQNWCHFTRIILTAIKNHVPTKTIRGRCNVPWITPGLRGLMRKTQGVYNLAKRTQNPQHWKKFKELRKTWKRSLLVAHNDCALGLLDWLDKKNSPSIGKKFWTYIKSKKKNNVISSLNSGNTEITDDKAKAEILSNQFKAVFTDERCRHDPRYGQRWCFRY